MENSSHVIHDIENSSHVIHDMERLDDDGVLNDGHYYLVGENDIHPVQVDNYKNILLITVIPKFASYFNISVTFFRNVRNQ